MACVKRSHIAIAAFAGVCGCVALFVSNPSRVPGGEAIVTKLRGKATVSDRVEQFGPATEKRWLAFFRSTSVSYPPQKLVLVALKQEKRLEVYASNGSAPQFIRSFPILGASGKFGPKLREGDLQVPEGVYRIESLNPNSAFHLALRVSYPNKEDRAQAVLDNRRELGGDIMIHGSNASVGCLAMGDEAAEDLFVLAAKTGAHNIEVLLCPLDFRVRDVAPDAKRPDWVQARYAKLKAHMKMLTLN